MRNAFMIQNNLLDDMLVHERQTHNKRVKFSMNNHPPVLMLVNPHN